MFLYQVWETPELNGNEASARYDLGSQPQLVFGWQSYKV